MEKIEITPVLDPMAFIKPSTKTEVAPVLMPYPLGDDVPEAEWPKFLISPRTEARMDPVRKASLDDKMPHKKMKALGFRTKTEDNLDGEKFTSNMIRAFVGGWSWLTLGLLKHILDPSRFLARYKGEFAVADSDAATVVPFNEQCLSLISLNANDDFRTFVINATGDTAAFFDAAREEQLGN